MTAYSATNDMQASNITINYPLNLIYVSSTGSTDLINLNATVRWTSISTNISNVSFVFTSGSTRFVFTNDTVNGTRTSTGEGDFTYKIQANSLTANLAYTVVVEIRNSTDLGNDGAVNSSSITFTMDSINPSGVTLERPHNKEGTSPREGIITLEYTFTEINAGNSTLYLNGVKEKASTSGTTTPNITSGITNKFTKGYTADDSSESWIIEITDLAGLKANSSAFTYSVIFSGGEIQTRQFTPSGQPIPTQQEIKTAKAQGRPFAVSQPSGNVFMEFLAGWWWVLLIVGVVGIFIWNKNRSQ